MSTGTVTIHLPDGTTATRRTDRPYTHALVSHHSVDSKRAYIQDRIDRVQAYLDDGGQQVSWAETKIRLETKKLSKLPPAGTMVWTVVSCHSRYDLAVRAKAKYGADEMAIVEVTR